MRKKKKSLKRRKKRRSKHSHKMTAFHIIAKALGGKRNKQNISYVRADKHDAYHRMFDLMTPDQVIIELVKKYWNGDWTWVERAFKAKHPRELENYCRILYKPRSENADSESVSRM